jgi:diadenosine tetraphosphatase ApaH/serine/threonine PP2A family protein phosphatase
VRGFNSSAAKAALWTAEKLSGENLKFLSNLPTHLRLDIKQRVYVVHGSPRDPLKGFISRDQPNRELAGIIEGVGADVVVFGHTHVPMKRMVMGKLIVNPGSVGQPRDRDPRASYAVLTIGKDVEVSHSRVDYDIERTAAKMRAAGLPEELAARLFFGW